MEGHLLRGHIHKTNDEQKTPSWHHGERLMTRSQVRMSTVTTDISARFKAKEERVCISETKN
jgi:hypothetical protein